MQTDTKQLNAYIDFAVEQFETATNNGAENPEGICIVTREGIRFGGHSYNDEISSAQDALSTIKNHQTIFSPDDLSQKFEIATIVIATPWDEKTKAPKAPQENTLNDLAEYIGTQGGQIIYVTSPNHDEVITLKLYRLTFVPEKSIVHLCPD